MTTVQEVAHIVVGLMTVFGAGLLSAFNIFRANFGIHLRSGLWMLAAGLLSIGVFNFALVAGVGEDYLVIFSSAAVLGAALAAMAAVILAQTAFQSRLVSALHHRVEAHRRTLERLRKSRAELERRVKDRAREVHEQEKRLRIALRDSNISVFMQDPQLRYIWMRNAPEGINAHDVIGKVDDEVLPPVAAQIATEAKRKVIETGEDVTVEICLEPEVPGGRKRYFDVTTEPYLDEHGALKGLLSVSVETTARRQREEVLKATLLEVSHRTKNQLAVLISIARRLGTTKPDTATFLPAFEARMRALSICQDVLVENDWDDSPLESLVRAQLEPYLARSGHRTIVEVKGPDVRIVPTAVQNLGLVLHELALNAYESGALDPGFGGLEISWDVTEDKVGNTDSPGRQLTLQWKERGARTVPSSRFRFGFGLPMAEKLSATALGGNLTVDIDESRPGLQARLEVGRSQFAA